MSRFSILTRLAALSVALLIVLAGSNLFLTSRISQNVSILEEEVRLVSAITTANSASRAFGDLKYWLTELAVSLLVLSESNAEAAREELDAALTRLEPYDSEAVAQIRAEVTALNEQAMLAVDAYTDDERVVGNMLMAEARIHVQAVDKALAQLVSRLEAEARERGAITLESANQAVTLSYWVIGLGCLFALFFTWLVLQSIRAPLGRLVTAMREISAGNLETEVPPPGHDEIGAMSRTLSMFRDSLAERNRLQAEREEAQESLRRAQTRLVEAIETINEGFVLYDSEDRLVICNSRHREMYAGADVAIEEGVPYETIARAAAEKGLAIEAVGRAEHWLAQRITWHRDPVGSFEQHCSDGRWLKINERKTQDGGIVGIFTDITEQKQREAELSAMVDDLAEARDTAMKATEAKGQFLANMSHELRTPLNAIIGITEMLEEDAEDLGQEEFKEPLQRISRAGKHLLSLINDILDLSKIEAGKMELHLEPIDIRGVIDDAVNMVTLQANTNKNRIDVKCPQDIGEIVSDLTRVRQVVFNLLSNACKFTEGGVITIEVSDREADQGIEVVVRDTGIGMSAQQVSRLFKEFSQADSSTTRKYGGSGLGLAISRRFCQMMGGNISVVSVKGKGSAFTVYLPRRVSRSFVRSDSSGRCRAEEVRTQPCGPGSLPIMGRSVLVVDDDPVARKVLSRFFEKEGFEVATAVDGKDGLARARQLRPSLITLDVLMPGVDGWSVLKELKADPELAAIPVMMVTILDEKNKGFQLGASDYMTKPVDRQRLSAMLAKYRDDSVAGTVLVVEDDPDTRRLLVRILANENWQVREAENGKLGLESVEELRPDLILLDLMMPEMDGFEFLAALRARPEWAGLPVVVVTAAELSEEDRRRLNGGVEQVIRKAARNKDAFLHEVHDFIEKHVGPRSAPVRENG